MVMCKYFLRGTCRFGESCKNEHAYNVESTASVMRKKGETDINVLIKAVSNDMDKAEKGNQWPLSCYGPFQGKPCFPGFEDKCFDEIRLGMYEAEKNGTVEQYKQQLTQLLHEARIKMRSLQNPTAEASHVLQELYNANTPEQQTSNVFANTNTFSNSPIQSNSVFNNTAAASKSIFNNQTPQSFAFAVPENKNIFANTAPNTNSIFAQANQNFTSNTGIFSGNQQPQQNQTYQASSNIFKTANNSIFGGQQTTTNQSPFGGAQPSQSTSNIFMQNNQSTQPPNPFKQNIQAPTQPGQSPFAAASVQQHQSPFGTNFATQPIQQTFPNQNQQFNTQPAFPTTFTQNTPFASSVPQNQSVFAQNQQPPPPPYGGFATTAPPVNQQPFASATTAFATNQSPFAPQTGTITENRSIFVQNNQPNALEHSKSIFGTSQSTIVAAPIMPRQDDPTIYSKLEILTENDAKCFEASSFEFGKIPDKPPTLQMCS